ncbi:MAG: Uma2 family endonuclease [Verrucomicrobia bacterium]|nr:Uma2 family endonuclease [Verrucomicrobiota bacterium]
MTTLQEPSHRLMTAEELLRFPDDDVRRELVRGELRTLMPPSSEHGDIALHLGSLLRQFVLKHGLGRALVESGFRLSSSPDTVRGPDLSVVLKDRVGSIGPGFFPGAPDLAIEIISPSDTYEEVHDKIDDYLNHGTREVWIVRLRLRSIAVHRPERATEIFRLGETLTGSEVLPGFSLPISDLFPAA